MPDSKIEELLTKYLEGSLTPEEKRRVDDWYETLLRGDDRSGLSDTERRALESYYWTSLKKEIRHGRGAERKLWPRVMLLAASVTAILAAFMFYLKPELSQHLVSKSGTYSPREFVNDSEIVQELTLPDSSLVTLFPGSKLRLASQFNLSEREIYLSGEAFFRISHNAEKPFYVFTNGVVTKVLGTTFNVKAYPEEDITVSVTSGRVSVSRHQDNGTSVPDSSTIILTPNLQAVYSRETNQVARTLVKEPQVIIPEEEVMKIRFASARVSEIFESLEKMYGIDIVYDENEFSQCSITTSTTGKDLYAKIDVICDITGAEYRIEEAKIIITGSGCH